MRKFLLLAVTGGLTAGSVSCVNLKKVKSYPPPTVKVAESYLEREGDLITVDLLIDMPRKYANHNTGIVFQPYIKGTFDTLYLPPFVVEGGIHDRFNDRQRRLEPARADEARIRLRYGAEDTAVLYSATAQYRKWMDHGVELFADVKANAYTREVPLGTIPVCGGILDLDRFISHEPIEKYYMDEGRAWSTDTGAEHSGDGLAFFAAGSTLFRLDAKESESINGIVDKIVGNPEVTDYQVSIVVSNSPEGSLSFNRELGRARAGAIRDYLLSIGVPDEAISTTVHEEGWDQLIAELPGLQLADRSAIYHIIATTSDPDLREKLIRENHPGDYNIILREVYPKLRYGHVTISTRDDSARADTYTHMLGNTGTSPTGTATAEIYELNARMLDAINAGETANALELCGRIPNTNLPEFIYYNKGMLMQKIERSEEAAAMFERAPGIAEARYNLGVLQLTGGEYDKAFDNFSGYTDMNAAVAALYTGRNTEAAKIILLLPPSPERDYLLAMAYVRLGRDRDAARMLSASVSLSSDLKAKAATEPDFNAAGKKAVFREILK